MQIQYRIKEDGIELVRMWQNSDVAVVPERIEDRPVTSIAAYAFSSHKEEEEGLYLYDTRQEGEQMDRFEEQETVCCGGVLREVHLPNTVKAIGNYAFYGCMNLKLFHGTDAIIRMGSGVFTGCRLEKVAIDFYDGYKSCLKEILTDIRYQIEATLCYKEMRTKILFPEYYADAVENTPARIVETHYYGSGGDYRECFYRRELDYGKYDALFALSEARDSTEAAVSVALMRLMYPWKLEEDARKRYVSYLQGQIKELVVMCVDALCEKKEFLAGEPQEILHFCCEKHFFTEDTLEDSITYAAEKGQTELLGILMDERYRHFPKKKKKYVL